MATSSSKSDEVRRVTGSRKARGRVLGSRGDSSRPLRPMLFETGAGRSSEWKPLAITAALTFVLTTLPLLLVPNFYYIDDTAGGAYGQWYELGEQLRAGKWPMLSLESWMAGNHIAEGQWGLFNPVIWLIGLITTVAPQTHVVAAGVKLFFLLIAALGTYKLARSYGARPALAVLAGVSAPVSGWTLYLDATAWVTNLQVWAYFPWVMYSVRLFMYSRRGVVIGLVAGLLLVTVGYVQGTVMLVLMFLALAVEAVFHRHWGALGRMILAGIPMGLMAVTVYLPGVLSTSVTVRDEQVENTGYMTLTLNGLAVSSAPSGRPDLAGWWGRYPSVPYTYIAWFLPLVLLASMRRIRALLPRVTGLLVFGALVLLWASGPSQLGPLRFPIRTMPWVALVMIVLVAVVLARGVDATRIRARLPLLVLAVLASFWWSYAAVTETWRIQIAWGIGCAVALVVVAILTGAGRGIIRRRAVSAMILVSVMFSGLQTFAYAHDAAGFGAQGFPTRLDAYTGILAETPGEAIIVGNPSSMPDGVEWDETLWGSTWYLSDASVANAYSPTGYRAFNDDLCMDPYYGTTCSDLLNRLFTPDALTGLPLVDMLSIDTVQILADAERSTQDIENLVPPEGWVEVDQGDHTITWVREAEAAEVGGPTWWTEGLEVDVVEQDVNGVRMSVGEVPAGGGQIVFSRLNWPGYRVTGGELGEPWRDYLVTVDVPENAAGTEVMVQFRPPGWELELATLIGSLLSTAALMALAARSSWRRRFRDETGPMAAAAPTGAASSSAETSTTETPTTTTEDPR